MYHSVPLLLAAKERAARIARERSAVTELLLTPAAYPERRKKYEHTSRHPPRATGARDRNRTGQGLFEKGNIFEKFGIVL